METEAKDGRIHQSPTDQRNKSPNQPYLWTLRGSLPADLIETVSVTGAVLSGKSCHAIVSKVITERPLG